MQAWIFPIRSRTAVLLAALFVAVTLLVMSGATDAMDQAAVAAAKEAGGNPVLDMAVQLATESGDIWYMLGLGILLMILRRTRRVGIALMSHTGGLYHTGRIHQMRCGAGEAHRGLRGDVPAGGAEPGHVRPVLRGWLWRVVPVGTRPPLRRHSHLAGVCVARAAGPWRLPAVLLPGSGIGQPAYLCWNTIPPTWWAV